MQSIKRLFAFFQRRLSRYHQHAAFQRPNALENSVLRKLPTELLQQVIIHLPAASAASFSLCCRHIYLSIGAHHLENLWSSDHEILDFLKLLDHDLHDHIVCVHCRRLHRMQDARNYSDLNYDWFSKRGKPDCLRDDMSTLVTSYLHKNFSTTIFKMVMKHYHQVGDDAQTRELLGLLSQQLDTDHWRGGTLLRTEKAECEIKNGSLLACKRVTFGGRCIDLARDFKSYRICPHLEVDSGRQAASLCITTPLYSSPYVSPAKDCQVVPLCDGRFRKKKTSWNLRSEHFQCQDCETEYEVNLEHNAGCTTTLTITIWKDLGQGPEAEKWKAHVPQNRRRSPTRSQERKYRSVFQKL